MTSPTIYQLAKDANEAAQEAFNEGNDPQDAFDQTVEDSLIYTSDIIALWQDSNFYDSEDYSGDFDILAQMRAAIREDLSERYEEPEEQED